MKAWSRGKEASNGSDGDAIGEKIINMEKEEPMNGMGASQMQGTNEVERTTLEEWRDVIELRSKKQRKLKQRNSEASSSQVDRTRTLEDWSKENELCTSKINLVEQQIATSEVTEKNKLKKKSRKKKKEKKLKDRNSEASVGEEIDESLEQGSRGKETSNGSDGDAIGEKIINMEKEEPMNRMGASQMQGTNVVERTTTLEEWRDVIELCTKEINVVEDQIAASTLKLIGLKDQLQVAITAVAGITGDQLQVATESSETTTQNTDIIQHIGTTTNPFVISGKLNMNHVISGHKKKVKSLLLCPTHNDRFLTSGHDGVIKHWDMSSKECHAVKLTEVRALIDGKWPEDVSWNPVDESVVAVYDRRTCKGDQTVAIFNFSRVHDMRMPKVELQKQAHGDVGAVRVKHMPWMPRGFVTASSGAGFRKILMWNEEEAEWTTKRLHSCHTNDV